MAGAIFTHQEQAMAANAARKGHGWRANALRAAVALGAVVLLTALLGRILDFGIRRDEMLFVAPAALMDQWKLYSDVFYNQVPYSAWLFRGSHLVAGDVGLLMSARLTVFAGWLLLLAASMWSVHRLSGSAWLAAFTGLALVTNDTLLGQTGMAASNNLLPLGFAVLAFGLFLVELVSRRTRAWPLFVAGLCLSIATGLKISAIVIIPPMVIAAFLLPQHLSMAARVRRVVLPALFGGLIGAAPLMFELLRHGDVFLAHVTGFHTGPHVAYWEAFQHTEPNLAMGLNGKLILAYSGWLSGSALLLFLISITAFWMAATSRDDTQHSIGWGAVLLASAVILVTMAMGFVPTPGFPQYYAAPIVFIPFVAALFLRATDPDRKAALVPVMASAMVLMLIIALPRLAPGLLAVSDMSRTEAAKFDRAGDEIHRALLRANLQDGKVATLMPLYPLEAGLDVYPELATGQFAYRVAEFTDAELAQHFVMAGPADIPALFQIEPPAAILLGYEPDLEVPLSTYASANGYRPMDVPGLSNRYGDGVLLLPATEGTE